MVLESFLYPLVAGLLLALLGWARRREEDSRSAWAAGFAWSIGFALAYYALKEDLPPWPPKEATHWLFFAMLAAGPIASLHGRMRSVPHWILGCGLLAAFVWFASEPLRKYGWEGSLGWQMPSALSAGAALVLLLNSDLVRTRPVGISVPGAFALTMGAGAFVLGQSTGGSAHLAGGLGVVGGLWALLALIRRGRHVSYGATLPYTLALGGLLFIGVFFASTPRVPAILLLLAPQATRLGWPIKNPTASFLVSLLGCAAACGIAAYLGYEPPSDDPYGY